MVNIIHQKSENASNVNCRIYNNGRIAVRYHLGSTCSGSDFLPQYRELYPRIDANILTLTCSEGRSSTNFLPFFGVDEDAMCGVNCAIGWSGAWKLSIELAAASSAFQGGSTYRISCGMLQTHFRVLPRETLRQPGMLLVFRNGKTVRDGQNEFRRLMLAHYSPRDGQGQLQKPPVALATWGGLEGEKNERTHWLDSEISSAI